MLIWVLGDASGVPGAGEIASGGEGFTAGVAAPAAGAEASAASAANAVSSASGRGDTQSFCTRPTYSYGDALSNTASLSVYDSAGELHGAAHTQATAA